MNNIILIGGGGHAYSCIDVIEAERKFQIIGLIDNKLSLNIKIINYKIIGNDSELLTIRKKCSNAVIAIGQLKDPEPRMRAYDNLIKKEFVLPIIKSPNSYVSRHSKIGNGTIVMHGAIVNIDSAIGNNCIINTSSLIEHNTKIGSHCHISTNATVNGHVIIGDQTFIGSGAIIHQGIEIGKNCVIGAGSIVRKNLQDSSIYNET